MNYKNNPFNQKKKFLVNPIKHWFETKSSTKKQPDKLQIRSKRLTTKQSQINPLKTLKILPFSLVSALGLSLVSSLHCSVCSHLLNRQQLKAQARQQA